VTEALPGRALDPGSRPGFAPTRGAVRRGTHTKPGSATYLSTCGQRSQFIYLAAVGRDGRMQPITPEGPERRPQDMEVIRGPVSPHEARGRQS